MKMTYAKVLEAAMALGKNDRRKLREELNATLDPRPREERGDDDGIDESRVMRPDMMDDEIFAELERRRIEAENDPSVMIPWEVVKANLEKEFGRGSLVPPAGRKRVRSRVPVSEP